jgi:diguanylate cyclase (GGDEF)-like protein
VGDLINQSISDICEDKDISVIKGKLANCVSTPDALQRGEIRFKHKYNDVIWVRATMRLISTNEKAAQILVTCEDISETKLLSEQLEYQAKHDPLTGLINRGEFERRLRRIIKYQDDSLEEEHALCYLDLDQFKVINDTSGHVAGDEMIRELSYVLSGVVRKRDTIARIGGDEFAILMEHCSLKQATRVANELLKAVDEFKFYWEGKQFSVGVSIGVVPIKFGDGSVQDILSVADAACFAAKDAGRNRMHVYKEDDDKFTRRQDEMEWVARINEALTKQQFCLAFQAIQYIGDKEQKQGKHYELLIRMKDENGDIIPPGVFLPSAERYNLAAKIDRWVVDTIFEHLIQNPDELDQLNICAINLSGHTFSDPEFLTMLQQRFKAGEIPAEKICFEITETAAVTDLGNAIQFMQRLKALGCKFALDDFGTGLSSFNYLKNLPVDYLKIDGSFIRDITSNPIDQAMVRSINDVGKVMGKEIIAEFVENDEIIQVLKEIGVDFAQGYGIHKPELLDIKII